MEFGAEDVATRKVEHPDPSIHPRNIHLVKKVSLRPQSSPPPESDARARLFGSDSWSWNSCSAIEIREAE